MEATMSAGQVDRDQRRFWAIAEILSMFLIVAGVLAAGGSQGGQDPSGHVMAVVAAETLVLTLIWWSQRRRGLSLADLGLTFKLPDLRTAVRTVGWSAVVAGGSAGVWVASAMAMSLVVSAPQATDVSMYDYLRGDFLAVVGTVAAVWVTSSFAEEVIYRGFLIHRLEEVFAGTPWATWLAVIVGGLVFGAVHYLWGPVGMALTAVMGMVWGTAYIKLGRRLWIVILAHGYMDTMLFVQVYLGAGI